MNRPKNGLPQISRHLSVLLDTCIIPGNILSIFTFFSMTFPELFFHPILRRFGTLRENCLGFIMVIILLLSVAIYRINLYLVTKANFSDVILTLKYKDEGNNDVFLLVLGHSHP